MKRIIWILLGLKTFFSYLLHFIRHFYLYSSLSCIQIIILRFVLFISVSDEPIWNLERRESSGHLFWCRSESKVKFRCDVEVLEYVKDPDEHKCYYDTNNNASTDKLTHVAVVCATCIAAIAVTVFLPWFLIGSN